MQGEVHTYDGSGNAVSRVSLYCNEGFAGAHQVCVCVCMQM